MIFIVIVFLFPANPNPTAASMNYTVVVLGEYFICLFVFISIKSKTGGTLVLATLYFFLPKYGGQYWFKGPVSTIGDFMNFDQGSDEAIQGKENTGSVDEKSSKASKLESNWNQGPNI